MPTNLDRYKVDLANLVERGRTLLYSMQNECNPSEFAEAVQNQLESHAEDFLKKLPSFSGSYQPWYSEAKTLLRQIMPDRLDDFVRLYEKPKVRKELSYGTYVIEDYLRGLVRRDYADQITVPTSAALNVLDQQVEIIKAVEKRFESSLFDIQQLVQADLFDSELEAAKELSKKGFARAAGAISGVVLEKHLRNVIASHSLTLAKKNPGLNDLAAKLKEADIIDATVAICTAFS